MPVTQSEGVLSQQVPYLTALQCSKCASQMSLDEVKPVLPLMQPSLEPVIMLQGTKAITPQLLQTLSSRAKEATDMKERKLHNLVLYWEPLQLQAVPAPAVFGEQDDLSANGIGLTG